MTSFYVGVVPGIPVLGWSKCGGPLRRNSVILSSVGEQQRTTAS